MNYATIKYNDISNGPGIRTSLFVSGCTHRCKGCFNSIAWDFNYGEPFEPQNQGALLELTNRVRRELPNKSIWCFSGYTIEQMLTGELSKCETTRPLLENIDVLVDGKFVEELKSLMLKFKGSSNQRTIMVKETLEKNEIVLWDK